MRASVESIWRQVPPPSSERYRPEFWIRNMRCAFVLFAIATDVRPASRGKPPPVISFQVTPSSVDLNRCVWLLGPPPPPPPPPRPPPPAPKTRDTGGGPMPMPDGGAQQHTWVAGRPATTFGARPAS